MVQRSRRNRDTDVENRHVVTVGGTGRVRLIGRIALTYIFLLFSH